MKDMNERQSNIELLRLVCMFLVIWVHFSGHSIIVCSEEYASQMGWEAIIPRLIRGLCWCAVNTFILISGYFSIRPKAKSFFNLYLVCAFYAGTLYITHLYLTGSHLNRWVMYNTLMPFGLWKSSSDWWFIPNYLILYILSPLLNQVIDNISKRKFQYFLLLQAIVVFYFGWYRNESWNGMGLNWINFIFIYFIGRYIAIYCKSSKCLSSKSGIYCVLYISFGIILGMIDCVTSAIKPFFSWMWFNGQYNNPLAIASAICLFMSFKSMNIKYNRVINWLAASALPIYLVHNNNYIIAQSLYKYVTQIYDTHSTTIAYGLIFLISIALMICIPLFDKLRMLITNPISKWLCDVYYRVKPCILSFFNRI